MAPLATSRTLAGPAVGVDIGGTNINAVVLSQHWEVLAETTMPTEPNPDAVLSATVEVVKKVARMANVPLTDLVGIGIGTPGVVVGGTVCHAVNLGIQDACIPLADLISKRLNLPVELENDLNAAALGAAQYVPLADDDTPLDLAFLNIGTGVAAGLVLDGVIRRGTGAAGEIGHVPYDHSGPRCKCGQRGCLELYASGSSLDRWWPWPGSDKTSGEALFDAVDEGNPTATNIKGTFVDAVAASVRLLALTVDPKQIVIGGGVAQLGDRLLDAVKARLTDHASTSPFLSSLNLPARVSLASPEIPIAAVGAATLAATAASAELETEPTETNTGNLES